VTVYMFLITRRRMTHEQSKEFPYLTEEDIRACLASRRIVAWVRCRRVKLLFDEKLRHPCRAVQDRYPVRLMSTIWLGGSDDA